MFGLTIEKLFVVALLAAVIIGPQRLPLYAGRLAAGLRRLKGVSVEAKRRAEEETGVALIREDWKALDPRQYDPRRIIREAWQDSGSSVVPATPDAQASDAPALDAVAAAAPAAAPVSAPPAAPATAPEREGRWVVTGSSAHPRRVWVPAEPVAEDLLVAAAS